MKYAKPLYKTVLATLCLSACALAYAQSAGNLSVRIGATQLKPAGASEDLSAPMLPGSKIQASTETGLTGGLTYMVTDNVAVDMPLGLGFKIDLMGAGM